MRVVQFLQEPFPYYLDSDRKNFWFSAGLAAFVTLNLTLFLPMEWIHIQKWIITGIIIFVVLYGHIVWLPKVLPKLMAPESWTVGKYMLATFVQLLLIGWIASVVLFSLNLYPGLSFRIVVIYYFFNMALYGGISIIVFTFVIRTVMLKNNLRQAMKANEELRRSLSTAIPEPQHATPVVTIQSDTSETLTISTDQLLYVEADDNYATFHWIADGALQTRMLRGNLKNIEAQLDSPRIVRCHRSYLVNVSAIVQVEGNTNGYRLYLRDINIPVPLSRSKGPHVLQLVGHQPADPRLRPSLVRA
ncbi:LytTR family DNA-binding domain-containing protein [Chryseolinea sp. T2]|uniref:LytR/AlgR family response regulator transcription factor n=1 Tax=Chryseolinea sp. T2 TaxID=3129255 RepID=UPI00307878DD